MVERTDRQKRLLGALEKQHDPVSGSDLAEQCGVTRQVVVHDIALLRAAGVPILSTHRGYWLPTPAPEQTRTVLSVIHRPELTETELMILVDHGILVKDVIVEHPLYGELRGTLHLASRRDVDLFLQKRSETGAFLLSQLTSGHHLHTVECSDPRRLTEAIEQLRQNGIEVLD